MAAVACIRFSPYASLPIECPHCGFLGWCSSANLEWPETQRVNDLVTHQQRQIKRGGYLHHAGDTLGSLYAVHSGFMKTMLTNGCGNQRIVGFSLPGELVGMDAISTGKHLCDAVALEDSTLCGIRYADLEGLACAVPALQRHFHRSMSAEIGRNHNIMFMLGSMNAVQRAAMFLRSMSKRNAARGYSGSRFRLPMTRTDIANYIGLKLETLCRIFSAFQRHGIIAIKGNDVEIRSLVHLQQVLESKNISPPPRGTCNIGNAGLGSIL